MDVIAHVAAAINRAAAATSTYEDPVALYRRYATAAVEEMDRLKADQLREAVDLVERARGCVTAALNCTAHPWHGDDRARKWLMDADRLGGR
jgi:hypothetical protein